MQYSFTHLALLAMAGLATAQIPSCATDCIAQTVKTTTSCGADDLACQCTADNEPKIQNGATSCVLDKCGMQAAAVLVAGQSACSSVNAAAPTFSTSSSSLTAIASSTMTMSSTEAVASSSSETPAASEVVDTSTSTSTSMEPMTASATSSYGSSVGTMSSAMATTATSTPIQAGAGSVAANLGGLMLVGVVGLAAL